jgi:hypothetical protein
MNAGKNRLAKFLKAKELLIARNTFKFCLDKRRTNWPNVRFEITVFEVWSCVTWWIGADVSVKETYTVI